MGFQIEIFNTGDSSVIDPKLKNADYTLGVGLYLVPFGFCSSVKNWTLWHQVDFIFVQIEFENITLCILTIFLFSVAWFGKSEVQHETTIFMALIAPTVKKTWNSDENQFFLL